MVNKSTVPSSQGAFHLPATSFEVCSRCRTRGVFFFKQLSLLNKAIYSNTFFIFQLKNLTTLYILRKTDLNDDVLMTTNATDIEIESCDITFNGVNYIIKVRNIYLYLFVLTKFLPERLWNTGFSLTFKSIQIQLKRIR